jgi:DNA-binding transcriptional LysR family regulator
MQDDVSIHDLKCAIVVAQEGSLSRAATRLHMSQPALGRRIHHVEAEVGVRLFYGWYGGVRLTESGKVFIEEILKSVDHWERAAQRARNVAHSQDGLFHMAYSSFLSPDLIATVSDLHFERPGDPIIKRTSLHTLGMIRGVLEGRYQVGIGYLPNGYSELEARELLDEDLMLCIPAQHRLFHFPAIAPQDLEKEPLIAISELALPEVYKEIAGYFSVLQIDLNVIAQPFTPYEAIHMVIDGKGIAMVSSGWSHLTKKGIAFRPLADKLLTMKAGVFVRRDNRTPIVNDFLNILWSRTEKLRNARQQFTRGSRKGAV